MSCNSKISKGKTLAKKLIAKYSNDLYKAIKFADLEGAEKYEDALNKATNINWLLDKASSCSKPRLCSTSFSKSDEGYVNDVLIPDQVINFPELWKGSVYNTNQEKLISISSYSNDSLLTPNVHTRLRFWEWVDNEPVMLFETDGLFDIQYRSPISIQYSSSNKAYYIKLATFNGDVSSPTLIKISEDFTIVVATNIQGTKSSGYPFQNALTEVVDKKNLIYVYRDSNYIDAYSLVDLSLVTTLNTGVPFQAMTYDCKSDSLFLTGGGALNNALIHQISFTCDDYTLETVYNSADYINNNSMMLCDGKMLVLTANLEPNPKLIFQVWSTCSPAHLKDQYVTDIELATIGNNFINLNGLAKDNNGNIFVYTLDINSNPVGMPSVLVFNKDYEFQYKQTLTDTSNFNVFDTSFYPDFNNSFIDPKTGLVVIHSQNQNGAGGWSTYFLDYEVYNQIKPTCLELSDDNVSALISKLNSISKCK